MRVIYDQDVDILRILLRDVTVEEDGEDKSGVILDYDKDGNMVGIQVLDASQCVENPRRMDLSVAERLGRTTETEIA